jgi:hypothetical protein
MKVLKYFFIKLKKNWKILLYSRKLLLNILIFILIYKKKDLIINFIIIKLKLFNFILFINIIKIS